MKKLKDRFVLHMIQKRMSHKRRKSTGTFPRNIDFSEKGRFHPNGSKSLKSAPNFTNVSAMESLHHKVSNDI